MIRSEASTACAMIAAMIGDGEGLAAADHVLRWSATTEVAGLGGVRVRGRSDVAHSSWYLELVHYIIERDAISVQWQHDAGISSSMGAADT